MARRRDWRRPVRSLHFWLGAVAMLYVMFVSLSGCAIVFEHELYRILLPDPPIAAVQNSLPDWDALRAIISTRYPQDMVVGIWERRLSAGIVAEVWLDGPNGARRRLVHPRTGEDLGEAQPFGLRALESLRRAHVAVLAGNSGRLVNAAGALSLILLSLSGLAMRRRRTPRPDADPRPGRAGADTRRRALAYHSAAGAWACLFGAMWGLTGACFAFPATLAALFGPAHEAVLEWLYLLHTGAAGGALTRALWTVSALSLPFLAITGMMMAWWRIRGRIVRWRATASI